LVIVIELPVAVKLLGPVQVIIALGEFVALVAVKVNELPAHIGVLLLVVGAPGATTKSTPMSSIVR
jgi:hypothetical protein